MSDWISILAGNEDNHKISNAIDIGQGPIQTAE